MRINAINNNLGFKGLFTNKSAQNNGNWLMEYSPYSWEANNTSKMANKQKFDIFDAKLPDNEEIYKKYSYLAENSTDILGTESYYVRDDGSMRRTITEVPAMNREESLKVQNKKLEAFLGMKNKKFLELKNNLCGTLDNITAAESKFDSYAAAMPTGVFASSSDRKYAAHGMYDEFDKVQKTAKGLYHDYNSYIYLKESADAVLAQKERNAKEINILNELRQSGKLIDISRRDLREANKPLVESFQLGFNALKAKFVCLPHKLMSMSEIIQSLGIHNLTAENKQMIVNCINRLI